MDLHFTWFYPTNLPLNGSSPVSSPLSPPPFNGHAPFLSFLFPPPPPPPALQEFVESSRRLERVVERGRSRVKEAVVSEGAEMKPMVSDSGGGGAKVKVKEELKEKDEEEEELEGVGLDGGGGEWEVLQEFHVYYLMMGVLLDWVLTEDSTWILCLSQDMVLFLCVYLPTSTLFLFATLLQGPGSFGCSSVTEACPAIPASAKPASASAC